MEFQARDRRGEGETLLRQTQLALLYLFDVFVEICEANHLRYFLDSGTLLGAMRHEGFIPWDDDLDVCMPEEDYAKFIKIASVQLPEDVLLQKPGQYPHDYVRSVRLRDRKSFFCEWYTNVESPSGIFIDIFPFGSFPQLPKRFGRCLMVVYYTSLFNEQAHRVRANRSLHEMLFHAGMCAAWKLISWGVRLFYEIVKLARPSLWNKRFGVLVTSSPGVREVDLFPLGTHMFEGRECSVPRDPDRYLTLMYGDWRTPPPKSERHGDHRTALILPTQAPRVWWAMPYKGESSAGE